MKAALPAALALATLALAGCDDPVHEDAVAALGPEKPGVTPGPLHRPGQPCGTCHGDGGPAALAFGFGGTAYQDDLNKTPLVGAFVHLTGAKGERTLAETNCAGNFYVEAVDFEPTYPVHVALEFAGETVVMNSHIGIDGSCADCHTGKSTPQSVDHVYFALTPMDFPPTGCP